MLTEERLAELEEQRLAAHKKAQENHIKGWNNLKPFKEIWEVPKLPMVDEKEWKEFYVPKLIAAGAMPKIDLVHNQYYIGKHRNATVAQWNKHTQKFDYNRRKFEYTFPEEIEHFEDHSTFDLFVPIKLGTEDQYKENKI